MRARCNRRPDRDRRRRAGGGNALRASGAVSATLGLPAIIARLRRVFDLGADPLAIAAHLAKDPTLAPLVRARPGLRVPGAWDGFRTGDPRGARPADHRGRGGAPRGPHGGGHGERLPAPSDALTHVFPPAEMSSLLPNSLRLGMPRSRAAALSAVAAAAVADPHLFDGQLRAR